MKQILLLFVIIFLGLAGCARGMAELPTAIHTLTLMPTPTLTETVKPTETLKSTVTPESTPTPEAPTLESQIKSAYTVEVDENIDGVQIKGSFITDESLDPLITKIDMPEKTGAEFISYEFFSVWWKTGNIKHTGGPTDSDYSEFMKSWKNAQETNNWSDVEFTIRTNNLGYIKIKPMYSGETNDDTVGISETNIFFVNSKKFDGFEKIINNGLAYQIEVIDNKLNIYASPWSDVTAYERLDYNIASFLSCIKLQLNDGVMMGTQDKKAINLLLNGGLKAVK